MNPINIGILAAINGVNNNYSVTITQNQHITTFAFIYFHNVGVNGKKCFRNILFIVFTMKSHSYNVDILFISSVNNRSYDHVYIFHILQSMHLVRYIQLCKKSSL